MNFEFTKDPVLLSEVYAKKYADNGKNFKEHDQAFRAVPRPYCDVIKTLL